MEIKNVRIYGLEESIIRSGYPMQIGEPESLEKAHYGWDTFRIPAKNRADKLANAPVGSGHDNFLKGIIVQFDLKYPQYFTPQLQRYHWIDIISSQSKMHSLTKVSYIKDSCNSYVCYDIIKILNDLICYYNTETFPNKFCIGSESNITIENKEECFQYIISNLPMGFELWMGISTNYLQLKNIYSQRKNHKLHDWRYFCEWVKTLPMSELIL